jgi:hypothetical protein
MLLRHSASPASLFPGGKKEADRLVSVVQFLRWERNYSALEGDLLEGDLDERGIYIRISMYLYISKRKGTCIWRKGERRKGKRMNIVKDAGP